jgi:Reverse transcriptase (RNA-dependent DNA polymerase)
VQYLDQRFIIKDLGALHFFLGIEVSQQQPSLLLIQSKYIYSILKRANMHGAKPMNTPMSTGQQLSKFAGNSMEDLK